MTTESLNAPYYIIPDILALQDVSDPEREEECRRRIAANIGDRESLMQILGISSIDPDDFYPDQKSPALDTEDTIAAFLSKFGDSSSVPGREEDPIPVAPAVDYMTLLEIENGRQARNAPDRNTPDDSANPLPEAPIRLERDTSRDAPPPDLTESFAKILIKNGNYSRAREILQQIHLKNSEKNIYFADQMRFLLRLEAIQSFRKDKKK